MPLITNQPRRNGSLVVTEFVDSVGTSDVTFSIPDNIEQETLQIYNISPIELLVSVGTQSNVSVPPYRGVTLNETFTAFTIKSALGVGGFRATCSYQDSDEEDEVILDDKITALTTSLAQSATKLGDITQLNTADKTSVVNAVKEIKTQANNNATSITNIGNASPKGTYASLSALQTAFPTGTTGIYLTTDNGHWYYWNASAWTDGGVYQSTGIADGSIAPAKTSFMVASENLINPTRRNDGYSVGYNWNVDDATVYVSDASKTSYLDTFPAVNGDIIYSNAGGRLVWYYSSGKVGGNAPFSFDSTLGLYKATVGASAVTAKMDAYLSNINQDGYWFVCKSTSYSGAKSNYGTSKLIDNVDSNIFGKKTDVTTLQTRVSNLETPTLNATFFVPHYLYCYDSNKSSKWIPKYNVMTARNPSDFYLDISAGWGFSRDWERVQTQDTDTVTIKNTVSGASVYSKQYTRRSIIPATKTNPATPKNVMVIGDSFSDAGYIPCDIKNQIVNAYGFSNFNFIGTKSDTINGVTALNEGRGGYTIDDFTKTVDTGGRGTTYPNPFLNAGVVNFSDYMSRNGFSGNLDYVIIELGVNNVITIDGSNVASIKTKMQGLIDLILASYPSCKIFVCGFVMLSKINGATDSVYQNSIALGVNKAFEDLCESAPYLNKCFYVDTGVFFDSDYGYQYSFTPYRGSTEQHKVQTDWLHPAEAGYYMMADTIASAFIYHMS